MTPASVAIAVIAALLGLIVITAVAGVLALRSGSPTARRVVARFNRAVMNPRQLGVAGRAGATMSLIRHRGRRSGAAYVTPVGATRVDGGFLVPLPYGAAADWTRNVLAAGDAVLEFDGQSLAVDEPRIVPVDAALGAFSPGERRIFRVTGVRELLSLRDVAPPISEPRRSIRR